MAVGFRFAGSANSDAFDCLVRGTTPHHTGVSVRCLQLVTTCFLVFPAVLITVYTVPVKNLDIPTHSEVYLNFDYVLSTL